MPPPPPLPSLSLHNYHPPPPNRPLLTQLSSPPSPTPYTIIISPQPPSSYTIIISAPPPLLTQLSSPPTALSLHFQLSSPPPLPPQLWPPLNYKFFTDFQGPENENVIFPKTFKDPPRLHLKTEFPANSKVRQSCRGKIWQKSHWHCRGVHEASSITLWQLSGLFFSKTTTNCS